MPSTDSVSTRRDFLKHSTAAAVTAWSTQAAFAKESPHQRPNLLIIHTDEHHVNTLGCYGGNLVETPNIDWLAKNGAIVTKCYAATPVCSPSRSSFLTGCYPQNTPVTENDIPMRDGAVTFAEVLRRKGYATGYAGKWHLDGHGKPQWEPKRRFGFDDNRYMFNRGHWKKLELTEDGPRVAARGRGGRPNYAVDGADAKSFTTDWLTDRAIDFLGEHKDGPFCYMLAIPDPHGPNTVRKPYNTMFDAADVYIPKTLSKRPNQIPDFAPPDPKVTAKMLRRIQPKYYGMVKCVDDNVGRILKALRKTNRLDNTIVVFTSDHGDLCGEHGRLNKGVPYDGSARIPLVIYYPEKIRHGTKVDAALNTADFMPTILSLMGHAAPETYEGRNASQLLTGNTPGNWNDVTFLRGTHNWLCAATSRFKLVYPFQGTPWLFDLEADPDELNNFFADPTRRKPLRELTQELAAYCKRCRDPYGDAPNVKRAMREVLG